MENFIQKRNNVNIEITSSEARRHFLRNEQCEEYKSVDDSDYPFMNGVRMDLMNNPIGINILLFKSIFN